MTSTTIIIPARLAAIRLPQKPILDINGVPMIIRVAKQAIKADVGEVYVAAGDIEIYNLVKEHGIQCIMTDPSLPSGTDRIAAAILEKNIEGENFINLQGDLPLIDPATIKAVAQLLQDSNIQVATAAAVITDTTQIHNPSVVKIALTKTNKALYFSRNAIPFSDGPFFHHIGIYGYKRNALFEFINKEVSALELREKLEQLRFLENDIDIYTAIVNDIPDSVDTLEDLNNVRAKAKRIE